MNCEAPRAERVLAAVRDNINEERRGQKPTICTREVQCEGRRGQKPTICTREVQCEGRRGQKGLICTRESRDLHRHRRAVTYLVFMRGVQDGHHYDGQAWQRHSPLISIPLTPFSRGHIRAYGLSIAARLPCPPTPARHLKMPSLRNSACEVP